VPRQPSRNMPKIASTSSLLGWVVIALFGAMIVYTIVAGFKSAPIITLITLCVVPGFYFLCRTNYENHWSRMKAGRAGESIGTFARSFDLKTVDTWVIRAVYEELQFYAPDVPLRKTDSIFNDLKVDPEDFEMDVIRNIGKRTGRSLENYQSNPHFGEIKTVESLVLFFNAQSKAT